VQKLLACSDGTAASHSFSKSNTEALRHRLGTWSREAVRADSFEGKTKGKLWSLVPNQHHCGEMVFHFLIRISWDAYNEVEDLMLHTLKKTHMVAYQSGSALHRIYSSIAGEYTLLHEKRNSASQASLWGVPKEPELDAARQAATTQCYPAPTQ